MTNAASTIRDARRSPRGRALAVLPMLALASVLQACGSDDPTEPPDRTLTVTGAGTHSGSVLSTPTGIECTVTAGATSGTCVATFGSGAVVTLQAIPAAGSNFAGWSGACSGTAQCDLSLEQDRTVTASFGPPPNPQ